MNETNEQQHIVDDSQVTYDQESFKSNKTFCQFGSGKTGVAEMDMVLSVERGIQNKYLSISVISYKSSENAGDENLIPVSETMFITDEKVFNDFKKFITELQWK